MKGIAILVTGALLLGGCGLAETAATGAAGATGEAEAARNAQRQGEVAVEQIHAAEQTAADQREQAERAATQ